MSTHASTDAALTALPDATPGPSEGTSSQWLEDQWINIRLNQWAIMQWRTGMFIHRSIRCWKANSDGHLHSLLILHLTTQWCISGWASSCREYTTYMTALGQLAVDRSLKFALGRWLAWGRPDLNQLRSFADTRRRDSLLSNTRSIHSKERALQQWRKQRSVVRRELQPRHGLIAAKHRGRWDLRLEQSTFMWLKNRCTFTARLAQSLFAPQRRQPISPCIFYSTVVFPGGATTYETSPCSSATLN